MPLAAIGTSLQPHSSRLGDGDTDLNLMWRSPEDSATRLFWPLGNPEVDLDQGGITMVVLVIFSRKDKVRSTTIGQ